MHPTGNLSHLLKTNVPPTHTEAASVTERLGILRNEILQLESHLQTLREEESRHLAVLSPVRRMPAELVGEILLLATPEVCDREAVIDVRDFCLVCKNWRDAAFLMRRLWCSLSVTPWDLAGPDAYNSIVTWLSRAGNLPKRIEFNGQEKYCDCRDGPCTTDDAVLQKLVKEGPALHHLGLKVVSIHCLQSFVVSMERVREPLHHRSWDSLASLDLAFCDVAPEEDSDSDDEDEGEITANYNAAGDNEGVGEDVTEDDNEDIASPNPVEWWEIWDPEPSRSPLYHIPSSITSLGLHLPEIRYAFPESLPDSAPIHICPAILGHLVTLEVRCDWGGDRVSDVLKHCPNLEDLTIDFSHYSPSQDDILDSPFAKSPLVLPAVRRLRLRNADTLSFLKIINTPAIEELDLGMAGFMHGGSDYRGFCSSVQKFLTCSQRIDGLQLLRIYNIWFPAGNIAPAIAEIPSLRKLTLDRAYVDVPTTIASLLLKAGNAFSPKGLETMKMSNSPLFPCLERLELLHVAFGYPFQDVIRCLQKRRDPPFCHVVGSYESQNLRPCTQADFDIATLRESGLSFAIVPSVEY